MPLSRSAAQPMHFALRLRVPDWSASAHLRINGEAVMPTLDRGIEMIE